MLAPAVHDLDACLEQVEALKVFPAAAMRIMRVAQSPDSTLDEMVEAVSVDPVLAASVLRVANSPLSGLRARVASLERAVHVLGLLGTRDVALGALVGAIATTVAPWGPLLHRHALLTGQFGRLLARYVPEVDGSEALVTGLLHDLGLQLLLMVERDNTMALLDKFYARPMLMERAEQVHYGFDHAELSAACVRRWGLPDTVADTIVGHHATPIVDEMDRAQIVLQVADHLAEVAADGGDAEQLLVAYRQHAVSSALCVPAGVLRQLMNKAEFLAASM